MNRYLLLILLASWSQLVTNATSCETGMAIVGHVLSVQRSLMANADVAFLHGYNATSLQRCLEECCSSKYGSCTVATFRKSSHSSRPNCLHFNCLPLDKCRFLSSNEADSFTFPALLVHPPTSTTPVPSKYPTSSKPQTPRGHLETSENVAEEETAAFSREQLTLKNDNTTIKPRKGVDESVMPEDHVTRSGVKARKGVTMDDFEHLADSVITKSKVKPRKGVGPHSTTTSPSSTVRLSSYFTGDVTKTSYRQSTLDAVNDTTADDLLTSLEKVFEDDPRSNASLVLNSNPLQASHRLEIAPSTSYLNLLSSMDQHSISTPVPTVTTSEFSTTYISQPSSVLPSETIAASHSTSTNTVPSEISQNSATNTIPSEMAFATLKSSIGQYTTESATSKYETDTSTTWATSKHTADSTSSTNAISDSATVRYNTHSSVPRLFPDSVDSIFSSEPSEDDSESTSANSYSAVKMDQTDEESENERKYKSSMHLVLSLVFGLLVLFAVMGVVAKRVYDGWLRRHYRRMDFLIDGMYNGYG